MEGQKALLFTECVDIKALDRLWGVSNLDLLKDIMGLLGPTISSLAFTRAFNTLWMVLQPKLEQGNWNENILPPATEILRLLKRGSLGKPSTCSEMAWQTNLFIRELTTIFHHDNSWMPPKKWTREAAGLAIWAAMRYRVRCHLKKINRANPVASSSLKVELKELRSIKEDSRFSSFFPPPDGGPVIPKSMEIDEKAYQQVLRSSAKAKPTVRKPNADDEDGEDEDDFVAGDDTSSDATVSSEDEESEAQSTDMEERSERAESDEGSEPESTAVEEESGRVGNDETNSADTNTSSVSGFGEGTLQRNRLVAANSLPEFQESDERPQLGGKGLPSPEMQQEGQVGGKSLELLKSQLGFKSVGRDRKRRISSGEKPVSTGKRQNQGKRG
jgi:hypothetical protein